MYPLPLLRCITVCSCLFVLLPVVVFLSSCTKVDGLSKGGSELARIAITEQPTGARHPGKIVWHDLLTSDLEASNAFYTELFGWQTEKKSRSAVVRNNGKLIASIIEVEQQDGNVGSVWMPSLSVVNVDDAAKAVVEQGGALVRGPLDMGRRGRVSLVEDVQGSHLVLMHTAGGDPEDTEAESGDWLWDEVWSSEPESLRSFYISVFGYQDTPAVMEDYTILEKDGKWRAGIRHVEKKVKNLLWVPVIKVADPVETAKRAEALGGRVLLSPEQVKNRGNVALLRDPAGAFFLIQRWTPEKTEGGN